uniref:Uncharacterized protein n=1 Tax=Ciona intestinalis TaxID=7719 RepID=F6WI10_CIOIN
MRNNQAEMDRGSSSAKKRRRNYDESYLKFGFTYVEKDGCQHPKCVICLKVLSVESMLPSKLKRHLMSTHSSLSDKPREFFARKLAGFQRQAASISTAFTIPSKVQLASFKVAYRIARAKKPHTIAENLILPAAIDMVSIMIGEPASKSLQKIPLSNNTIARRIDKIALDVNDQLMSAIRGKVFALQLDEATDSNKDAHLICYVRFIGDDNVPVEDLFFCRPITESCRAANLFEIVNNFIESNGIEWKMCVGICTDGARAMSGSYGGLRKKMCDDAGAEHNALLFYCSARWLSKGKVLLRVYELRNEIANYLQEEKHQQAANFKDVNFLTNLAYLCDIFGKLNHLNTTLQGKYTHAFGLFDKITGFRKKFKYFLKQHLMENFISHNLENDNKDVIYEHLDNLSMHFEHYFPENMGQHDWIRYPFNSSLIIPDCFSTSEAEQFADLASDFTLKTKFESSEIFQFWSNTCQEYPQVRDKALRVLLPFATSYLCEAGFSAVASIKTKYRSRLDIEIEMRVCISSIPPRFEKMCSEHQ